MMGLERVAARQVQVGAHAVNAACVNVADAKNVEHPREPVAMQIDYASC